MKYRRFYHKLLLWRARHLSNRNFILLMAFVVGLAGGGAAIVLKTCVHYVQHWLTLGLPARFHNYLFFFYPFIGILLTVLVKNLFRFQAFGHGMADLLLAISKRSGILEREKMYSHILSATLTVGFGGSLGLEAPIVTTGAAIGSNLAQLFHVGYKKRMLLIGCGVAAGIGGIFNAPIAGIIFCLEVLMLELSVPAFIPLLIAAVTGTMLSRIIMGNDILFNSSASDIFNVADIPFYLILSVITGLISAYFLRNFARTSNSLHRIKNSYWRAVWGSLLLGGMIFLFPPLYGEGYSTVKALISGDRFSMLQQSFFFHSLNEDWFLLAFTGCMIALKVFASSATSGAGGNGGTFAPSLMLGGIVGFFVAHLINTLDFLPFQVSEKNFILVGMAGTLSGIMRAPLTAIFLIAEITGGYNLILPLMIVSAISFVTSSYLEPHSVYLKQLAKKGHVHYHDKDRMVLQVLKLDKIIENDFIPVKPEGKLKDLISAVENSRRNIFPVINGDEVLEGIINLDDIRKYMFKPEMYEQLSIKDLMHPPVASVSNTQSMEDVMATFDRTGAWNLPVIDQHGHYMGLISRSRIFSHYRKKLQKYLRENTEIIE